MLSVEAAKNVALGRPLHIVADEQVEQTVAIEIEPQGRRAEALPAAEPARLRDIDKMALAGILEEPVLADAGDENIGEAVVVVIADGHSHAVHLDVEPGAAA